VSRRLAIRWRHSGLLCKTEAGTVANDITEIKVIKTVFGDEARRLSISSTKSMHGHALGASGSVELIAVIEAIRRGIVPPTINIEIRQIEGRRPALRSLTT
jgi:3-oxoacyl-(acyl-carrier-protein) synthase